MPTVKSITIHKNIQKAIDYILEEKKTDKYLLVSGMNVSTNNEIAGMQFRYAFNEYKGKYKSRNKSQAVGHHFVQSFKPGEVTPQLAHEIALKTCKEHFGEDIQILISTHIDKEHIHNHILVNSVDLNAKKYYANRTSLKKLRGISDTIAKENGLSIVENPKFNGMKYNLWQGKQRGYTWRDIAKIKIDTALINSNDITELIKNIKEEGLDCEILKLKSGVECLRVKEQNFNYFANTKNLGKGYSLEELQERIANRDIEFEKLKLNIDKIQLNVKVVKAKPEAKIKYRPYKKKVYTRKVRVLRKVFKGRYKASVDVRLKRMIFNLFKAIDRKEVSVYKKWDRTKPYSKGNDYYVNELSRHLSYVANNNIQTYSDIVTRLDLNEKSLNDLIKQVNLNTKRKSNIESVLSAKSTISLLEKKTNLDIKEKQLLEMANKVMFKAKSYNISEDKYEQVNFLSEEIKYMQNEIDIFSKEMKQLNNIKGWLDESSYENIFNENKTVNIEKDASKKIIK